MSFVKVGSEIQLRFFLEPVTISNDLKTTSEYSRIETAKAL